MACRDGAVQLWNLLDGKLVRNLVAPIIQANGVFVTVRFNPSGARLAVGINDQVSIWDAGTGAQVSRFSLPKAKALFGISPSMRYPVGRPSAKRNAAPSIR